MIFSKIKSYAKINIALNVTGKSSSLHKIESIIAFARLHDDIFIRNIKSNRHKISFFGEFSKNINNNNTVSKLLRILEKNKIIQDQKFEIKIKKRVPNKAGLGGGSMNAASILKFLLEKKIIKIKKKEIFKICKLVGSDVILGLNSTNTILTSKNKIKYFRNSERFNILIVKPNFGCATKKIFSKVTKFNKPKFNNPSKKMFNTNFLKKMNNFLEPIVFSKYSKLRSIKFFLKDISNPLFIRMTGSGSALVAYYPSKEKCENARAKFSKKYKNYWSIASKTI